MKRLPCQRRLLGLGLLPSVSHAWASECGTGNEATALIYDDIEIDGDTSDWPEGLQTYQISSSPPGEFRVLYSPDRDRIAVAVAYDGYDPGEHWADTDAIEVYTWGGDPRSEKSCEPRGGSQNPIQFAFVPGDGSYVPGCGNPCAVVGGLQRDAASKGAEVSLRRAGTRVNYELSLPVYTDFDDLPVDLHEHGRAIGFDVVVVDKQSHDGRHRWVP